MVYEQFEEQQQQSYQDDSFVYQGYGSTSSTTARLLDFEPELPRAKHSRYTNGSSRRHSLQVPAYQTEPEFMLKTSEWASIAEATMPLKTSQLLKEANRQMALSSSLLMSQPFDQSPNDNNNNNLLFQASLNERSRQISRQLVWVNLVSLLVNLFLALVAFYFSFVNNSSSTTAFAADCVLDLISSAIVLWRYYGDLDTVYMHAREQIACIYLGALFEISAFGIIIKASSDIATGIGPEEGVAGYDLIYLAIAATVACTVITVFKCSLYRTIRDKSILLDVINTLISTVFAMSIIMSQLLISVDSSFWYMDPILSIVLAIFMAAFGLKVISQNFNILRPGHRSSNSSWSSRQDKKSHRVPLDSITGLKNYENNLQTSMENQRSDKNWQKSDYSTIAFI